MSEKITRYDLEYVSIDGEARHMVRSDDGDWVRYEDVLALVARLSQPATAQDRATRTCLGYASRISTTDEDEPVEPQPIGQCPKCGAPWYSKYGFCGVCKP